MSVCPFCGSMKSDPPSSTYGFDSYYSCGTELLRAGTWYRGRQCFINERNQLKRMLVRCWNMLSLWRPDDSVNNFEGFMGDLEELLKERPYAQ